MCWMNGKNQMTGNELSTFLFVLRIDFYNMTHTFKSTQFLKTDIHTCWDFFSSPENLKKITPDHMGFDILSKSRDTDVYQGMIINYIVRPLFNIPTHWTTEITHVKAPFYFVDEQRVGPYKMWHHEHHFIEKENGVEMIDIISYALPMGFLGDWVHPFLVRPKLKQIFDYRSEFLEEYFNGG